MREDAREQGCPEPIFEENGFFTAIFRPNPEVRAQAGIVEESKTAQVGTKFRSMMHRNPPHMYSPGTPQTPLMNPPSTPKVLAILKASASGEKTRDELQTVAEIKDRKHFRKQYIAELLASEFLERTIPDKPSSPKQRYRTTPSDRAVRANAEKERQP